MDPIMENYDYYFSQYNPLVSDYLMHRQPITNNVEVEIQSIEQELLNLETDEERLILVDGLKYNCEYCQVYVTGWISQINNKIRTENYENELKSHYHALENNKMLIAWLNIRINRYIELGVKLPNKDIIKATEASDHKYTWFTMFRDKEKAAKVLKIINEDPYIRESKTKPTVFISLFEVLEASDVIHAVTSTNKSNICRYTFDVCFARNTVSAQKGNKENIEHFQKLLREYLTKR
jgi:hypothetical protein